MKKSANRRQKTGCLDPSGILNGFMSREHQPFVSKKNSILDSQEKSYSPNCVNREVTSSFRLETAKSGVKRGLFRGSSEGGVVSR